MKLNINKDKLLKHKFWILLAVAIPLILAGQFVLLGPVAGEIEGDKGKVLATIKGAANVKGNYNEENAKQRIKVADELKEEENKVWKSVYDKQAGDMFWPELIEKKYPVRTGQFLRELKSIDGAAVADDKNTFSGKLVQRKDILLTLAGKDGTEQTFFYMEEMKLADGKPLDDKARQELIEGKDYQATFQTGWYFNDKLTENQRAEYENSYATQIRPLLDIVEPVNEEGEGVVTFKGWQVPKKSSELPPEGVRFLRFVTPPWKTDADISEEAWLAQEDLWIQKEFYRLIRQANDYVGKMEGKGVVGLNQTATFKNPYFELGLKLIAQDKLEVTIKNLQNKRQKLEVKFRARFSDDKSYAEEKFAIDGEPLDPLGTLDKQKVAKDVMTKVITLPAGVKRTGIYNVEQALTWETAAVRRIDAILIGSVSGDEIAINHRAYPEGVKPLVPEKKEEPAADAQPPVAQPVPQPMSRGGRGPRGGPGGGIGQGAPNADLTVNGLNKQRYCEEPTEQTRRLPVAISLIVDQDHIDRVLTSFSNSKYRFLLNQFMVNRYPASVRPVVVAQDGVNPPPVFGGPFGVRGPGFGGPRGGPRPMEGGGVRPVGPFGPGGRNAPAAPTGDEEMEANVELVLYGTVTVYQRYPQRKLPKTEAEAPK